MQSINLYQLEIKQKVLLNFMQIIQAGGLCLVLLCMSTIYEFYDYYELQKEYNSLNQNQQDLSLGLDNMQKQIISEHAKKEASNKVVVLQKSLQEQQLMYSTLVALQSGGEHGFHQYLQAFSNYNIPEIWLTEFDLGTNGANVKIVGQTSSPNKIPILIQSLGEHDSFKSMIFEVFKLEVREENNEVTNFHLETIQ